MCEPKQTLRISVILVCYNSRDWLPKCVQSLLCQTCVHETEIIIVDNASADGSEELARQLTKDFANSVILQTGFNAGFARANNRGAQAARGRYLYFLNPDTWLEPDCLEQLYSGVELAGAAGGCGTLLEYEDQKVQAKGNDGFDIFGNPVAPRNQRDPKRLFCIAGFYFIRRNAFFELGMMDEALFMYGEEIDLSWRVWISGQKLQFTPAARLHHRGAVAVNPAGGTRSVENRTSPTKRFLANRNSLVVIAKNCQHVLLLMIIPCAVIIFAEGFATLLATRKWSNAKRGCFDSLIGFWKMRHNIRDWRRKVRALRRRSDFWMLRFLRFRFGRTDELKKMLKGGFPKFN